MNIEKFLPITRSQSRYFASSETPFGIEDLVDSIEVGKDADIVIWSGDPFDLRESVELTMINGEIVFQRN
nr:amidohydrolase family protein [Geobacillus sp. C56-T2]